MKSSTLALLGVVMLALCASAEPAADCDSTLNWGIDCYAVRRSKLLERIRAREAIFFPAPEDQFLRAYARKLDTIKNHIPPPNDHKIKATLPPHQLEALQIASLLFRKWEEDYFNELNAAIAGTAIGKEDRNKQEKLFKGLRQNLDSLLAGPLTTSNSGPVFDNSGSPAERAPVTEAPHGRIAPAHSNVSPPALLRSPCAKLSLFIAGKQSANSACMVIKNRHGSYKIMLKYLNDVLLMTGTHARMRQEGIDPLPFMLALIKAESEFNPGAQSNIRNKHNTIVDHGNGYAQMLDTTAQGILRLRRNRTLYRKVRRKEPPRKITDQMLLRDWKLNIFISVLKIDEQLRRFSPIVKQLDRSPEDKSAILINLMAGAHNAGEGAVGRFLIGSKKSIDLNKFDAQQRRRAIQIATRIKPSESLVSYRETTDYVRKIQTWYAELRPKVLRIHRPNALIIPGPLTRGVFNEAPIFLRGIYSRWAEPKS